MRMVVAAVGAAERGDGRRDPDITAAQLAETGVKRISVGGALSRLRSRRSWRPRAR